jgi:hypothetical protein
MLLKSNILAAGSWLQPWPWRWPLVVAVGRVPPVAREGPAVLGARVGPERAQRVRAPPPPVRKQRPVQRPILNPAAAADRAQ